MFPPQPRTPVAPQKGLTTLAEKGAMIGDCTARYKLLNKHRAELLAKYPDQCAALGDNWVFVVAETRQGVREKLVECGAYLPHSAIIRLETNPPHRIPG